MHTYFAFLCHGSFLLVQKSAHFAISFPKGKGIKTRACEEHHKSYQGDSVSKPVDNDIVPHLGKLSDVSCTCNVWLALDGGKHGWLPPLLQNSFTGLVSEIVVKWGEHGLHPDTMPNDRNVWIDLTPLVPCELNCQQLSVYCASPFSLLQLHSAQSPPVSTLLMDTIMSCNGLGHRAMRNKPLESASRQVFFWPSHIKTKICQREGETELEGE